MVDDQNPAGWYPDPSGDMTHIRYWDGSAWTETTYPVPYNSPIFAGMMQPQYPMHHQPQHPYQIQGQQLVQNPYLRHQQSPYHAQNPIHSQNLYQMQHPIQPQNPYQAQGQMQHLPYAQYPYQMQAYYQPQSPYQTTIAFSSLPYQPVDNRSATRSKLAIAAMVCGIAGIPSCVFYIGVVPGLLGIIFGILGLKSKNKGMAVAGIACGAVAVLFFILYVIGVITSTINIAGANPLDPPSLQDIFLDQSF